MRYGIGARIILIFICQHLFYSSYLITRWLAMLFQRIVLAGGYPAQVTLPLNQYILRL